VIDTVLSQELKGMASDLMGQVHDSMGKVRNYVQEDACPVRDTDTDTITVDVEDHHTSKLQ
jgi:hypothetical protein